MFQSDQRPEHTPLQNGSVFDCLIVTCIIEGDCKLSTAMSAMHRCASGSKWEVDGVVISPTLKKPKKHRVEAAHINFVSHSFSLGTHTSCSCLRMCGVIGRHSLALLPPSTCTLLIPRITYLRCGICAVWPKGSDNWHLFGGNALLINMS